MATHGSPYPCHAGLKPTYPFRPMVKTAVDQTHSRSFKTKEDTIRPPPLPAINGVAGSGSLLPPGTHPNP